MSAYNALKMQNQLPDLEQRLEAIRAGEKDERVKRFFNSDD